MTNEAKLAEPDKTNDGAPTGAGAPGAPSEPAERQPAAETQSAEPTGAGAPGAPSEPAERQPTAEPPSAEPAADEQTRPATVRYRVLAPVFVNGSVVDPKGRKDVYVLAAPGLEGSALKLAPEGEAGTATAG